MYNKLASLAWQLHMGADEAIANSTSNRFENTPPTKQTQEAPRQIQQVVTAMAPHKPPATATQKNNIGNPSSAMQATRKMAEACKDLDGLKIAVENFKDLSITKTATNTVFADGNHAAQIMLIGEAPGADEDMQGIPFCGASGKLLEQMLACIGLKREKNFYITNTIFWRPPGNRRPTPEELAVCLPFVEKHIALVAPKLIVLVGGTAIASLLNSKEGITSLRGNFFEYNNIYLEAPIKTTAIFHPSYLLRSPGQKRVAWKDLLMLKQHIIKESIKL